MCVELHGGAWMRCKGVEVKRCRGGAEVVHLWNGDTEVQILSAEVQV